MEYMGKRFNRLTEQDLKIAVCQNGGLYSLEIFQKPTKIEVNVFDTHSLKETKKKCLEKLNRKINDKYPI